MNSKTRNIPTVFVILGATGDLMGRKIIPSLFHLYISGSLPKLLKIIAFSRRELSTSLYQEFVRKNIPNKYMNHEQVESFLELFSYHQGDFNKLSDYENLAEKLGRIDGGWNVCSNKLFYLAVPPQYYENIFEHLKISGLTMPCGPDEGWTRILVEKPFGKDFKTAQILDARLGELFKEEQIYRIDHYLAKEMIQNILSFRFSNNLFEKIWNFQFIESVEVRLLEDMGIEGRMEFYDGVGALRDVGQNHLLQMLSLVTMDEPLTLSSEDVRKKRTEVLENLSKLSNEEIKSASFRGQFEGYSELPGVNKISETETYFRVIAHVNTNRFRGVPVILEAGKNIIRKKEIIVTFKHPTPCFCPQGVKEHFTNKVIFSLEPKEKISIEFWIKKPGLTYEMVKQTFDFSYKTIRKNTESVDEYEKLLLDCILGNQLLFVSTREVLAMWEFIDPIELGWQKNLVPLVKYKPGKKDILVQAKKFEEEKPLSSMHKKEVGVIGLGKMGGGIARQLLEKGWKVVGYNRSTADVQKFEEDSGVGAYSIPQLVDSLLPPRIIILSVPNDVVDEVLFGKSGLINVLEKNDVIIDMGNSFYKNSSERYRKCLKKGIYFVDVGVSGGPAGARFGASLMVGGEESLYHMLFPLYQDLAVIDGVEFFKGSGAGHFVKMVHNGIEYGMMQSIAEGFTILKESEYNINLKNASSVFNNGSVIESRLVGWLREGFEEQGENLDNVSGSVEHTGEGLWTIEEAEKLKIPVPVIKDSYEFRIKSVTYPSFTGKILSLLRNKFGGHEMKRAEIKIGDKK